MRCLLSTLALVVVVAPFTGCRSQATGLTNPFLAPDRVPPPSTRTLLPGTAQPYYPGDPVPNSPAIGAPPAGFAPGTPLQQTRPTFAPQPAGTVPPGGWNTAPQPYPSGSSSRNVLPSNIQQTSAVAPASRQATVQVQPDQQSLRFGPPAPLYQQPVVPAAARQTLPPDPSILPTPQQGVSPYPNQQAAFQAPLPQQQFAQQVAPIAQPREVRIRAISSDNSRSRDGFRPQGSSRVRKPTIMNRLEPRKRQPARKPDDRFGFDPQYTWLRGELQHATATGQWSLRYVPGQSAGDSFGGILTIANSQVLGDLQPGDFVQLRGRVDQVSNGRQQAPVYNVSVVQRQRI